MTTSSPRWRSATSSVPPSSAPIGDSDLFALRARLMADWAAFCAG